MAQPALGDSLSFCIPVFNDWTSVAALLPQLDELARELERPIDILLVDDGSTEPPPAGLARELRHVRRVALLPLRRNLGHQRAIALGLTFLFVNRPARAVVVMDGDGEDAPADVPALLREFDRHGGRAAVFAARARRSESLLFLAGYTLFKLLHRLLTGRKVEVGNFSVMPSELLSRLVGVSEVWNHYAAAVYKARLAVVQVPIPRRSRLAGESTMDVVGLITHGLSAISVYGETVGVRLLCVSALLIALTAGGIVATVGVRLFTPLAIPGWATTATGVLSVLLVSLSLLLTVAVLFVLQSRDRYSFMPLRDYVHYLLPERVLHG